MINKGNHNDNGCRAWIEKEQKWPCCRSVNFYYKIIFLTVFTCVDYWLVQWLVSVEFLAISVHIDRLLVGDDICTLLCLRNKQDGRDSHSGQHHDQSSYSQKSVRLSSADSKTSFGEY